MSFKQRIIQTTFALGTGSFGADGSNVAKLKGLRTSCRVAKAGGRSMSTLDLEVYGMTLSQMNQLSTLGFVINQLRKNSVLVEAGDEDGLTTVFKGTVTNAWADMEQSPEVPFRVEAQAGMFDAVKTLPPKSYTGPTSVADIIASIAQDAGARFENNGVDVIIPTPYLNGSPLVQARQAAKTAGINLIVDDDTYIIWPKGGSRGGSVPRIDKDSGLVRSPRFDSYGIGLTTVFNPSVGIGSKVEVHSDLLTAANGQWVVYNLDYKLDANLPGGDWFQDLQAARPGVAPPVVQ